MQPTKDYFEPNRTDLKNLKTGLKKLLRPHQMEKGSFDLLQQTIWNCYCQPHRKYHNLSHIRMLLDMADSYKTQLDDFLGVCLAIWFHDIVYDTQKNDNEEKSAELALTLLGPFNIDDSLLKKVAAMILATKTHQALDNDSKLLIDFDLAILGASSKRYVRYAHAIRQEYSWIPDALYRKGRKEILNNFLDRSHIYSSAPFRDRLETKARENIQNEIVQLSTI